VAHADLFPSFQLVNNITRFSKGAGHASRHGRAHFGRLVNAADMGENCLYAVDDFRFKKRMPSRAAAVRELLKRTAAVGAKSSAYGVTGKTPVERK